jgi:comEA protein
LTALYYLLISDARTSKIKYLKRRLVMKRSFLICSLIVCVGLVLGGAAYAAEPKTTPKEEPKLEGFLNINTATIEEFQMLPGIGEATAKNIVEYRKVNGPFQSVDDLLKVKGIGEKRLKDIKPYCRLEGKSTLKVLK